MPADLDPTGRCLGGPELLGGVRTAELDRYDAAVAALDEQRLQLRRARDLQLKRLRYEAGLAEKQYRLVDPENRLVAVELERRWEQALQALCRAEEEAQAPSRRSNP